MSLSVEPRVPPQLVTHSLSSTGQAVIRKTRFEYFPSDNTIIGPENVSNFAHSFRTRITSADFINWGESHFRLPLIVWQNGTMGINECRAMFDVGGVHAIFRQVEVRAVASGTQIQLIENYNRLIAHLVMAGVVADRNTASNGREDGLLSMFEADDNGNSYTSGPLDTDLAKTPVNSMHGLFPWGVDPAGETSVIERELIFRPYMSFFNMQELFPLFLLKGGIEIILTLDSSLISVVRFGLLASGTSVTIPAISSLQTITAAATFADYRYKIVAPVFIATIVEVDASVVQQYQKQYDSEAGVLYSIPNWVGRERSFDNGVTFQQSDVSVDFTFGVRSARRAFTVIQSNYIRGGNQNRTIINRSLSHGLRSQIYRYSYTVGSEEYPRNKQRVMPNVQEQHAFSLNNHTAANGPVGGNPHYPTELYHAILRVMQVQNLGCHKMELAGANTLDTQINAPTGYVAAAAGMRSAPGYCIPSMVQRYNGCNDGASAIGAFVSTNCVEPSWCIFPVDFSRDNSFLCGVDTTQVPVFFKFDRTMAASIMFTNGTLHSYNCWLEYDCILKISADGVYIIN